MPTGVTGIARARTWDATVLLELPELRESTHDELELRAIGDDLVAGPELPPGARERTATAVDAELPRPWEALLVRRGSAAWSVGARRTHAELVLLPGVSFASLEVAVAPGGDRSALVDGAPVEPLVEPAVDEALRELERRGRLRFQAFAARADNLDGERWQLSIDPL